MEIGEYPPYMPLPTEDGGHKLNSVFLDGVLGLNQSIHNPFERAMAYFLFGALQQFFFSGNQCTSIFMMNGVLLSSGIDPISIPASKVKWFNEKMVRFYLTKDATEMMVFLIDCHPDAMNMRSKNPNLNTSFVSRSMIQLDPKKSSKLKDVLEMSNYMLISGTIVSATIAAILAFLTAEVWSAKIGHHAFLFRYLNRYQTMR